MRPTTRQRGDHFQPDSTTVFTSAPAVTFSGGGAPRLRHLDASGHISGIVAGQRGQLHHATDCLDQRSSAALTVATMLNAPGA
jgi:hypothetical protein